MSQMLLSINPDHVKNILSGEKKYEFRKTRCRSDVSSIVIYATSPMMCVVAEAEIIGVIEDTPQIVWNETFHMLESVKIFLINIIRIGKKQSLTN